MRKFLAAALVLAASQAVAFTPFHELRNDHDSIDAAIASLPTSEINGTLNRISSLLDRGTTRDLAAGAGLEGELPNNFEDQMVGAIQDLQGDLKEGFFSLTLEEQGTILQVVDVLVIARNVELYDGWNANPCIPNPEFTCPDVRPAVIRQLDQLAGSLRSPMVAMIQAYNADPASVTDEPLPGAVNAATYDTRLDRVRATFLTIKGVESIDD